MRARQARVGSNWPGNFYLGDDEREPLRRERSVEGMGALPVKFAPRFSSPKSDGPAHPLHEPRDTARQAEMVRLAAEAVARRDRQRAADRASARDALEARAEIAAQNRAHIRRLNDFNNRWPD